MALFLRKHKMSKKTTIVEQAWQDYQRKLIAFIRSKVDTSEDAEDILNDVFASLVKKTGENDTPDNIASWLYRVTRNRIVDYYRAKKRFEELPEDLASESVDTNIVGQLSDCMLPMIKALPMTYQQPLILSEIEGKKYKEVADELDLTLSAVKSRILRGRKKLHKNMIRCCTFYRDNTGNIMDYEKNKADFCNDCDR
jgi:RNA polymerase sigma-70 factor (ECF subfamily)